MKKITVLTIVGLLLFSGASYATEMKSTSLNAPSGVWITLHLKFHKPKWDCERGFGLCFNITWGIERGAKSRSETECPVKMKLDNNQLIMEVEESDLQKYEQGTSLAYFNGKSTITLDENTEIPPSYCRQLGSSRPIVIKSGTYPVTYKDNIYTIVFTL